MSRLALGQKTGVIAAVAALVMGLTAAAALGWANEGKGEKEKEHGNKPPPTVTVPPPTQTTPTPPVTQPPPATPAPPPPVVSQGTTPTPTTPAPVGGESAPAGNEENGESAPQVAQAPQAAPPLAPAAERKELAETGIDPGLIALLGALCLVGGALLFRRSLARG